ncbi:MAG: hypothetical protein ACRC0Y_08155 [Fusobacteriaceae bacterium]
MNDSVSEIAKKLFENSYITKVELQKFLAEEEASLKLFHYNLDKIQKEEELQLRKLQIYKRQIESSQDILDKLSSLNEKKKDVLLMEITDEIIQNINLITKEITQNYSQYLSVKIKKEIEGGY